MDVDSRTVTGFLFSLDPTLHHLGCACPRARGDAENGMVSEPREKDMLVTAIPPLGQPE
jgi:hypothetical protein